MAQYMLICGIIITQLGTHKCNKTLFNKMAKTPIYQPERLLLHLEGGVVGGISGWAVGLRNKLLAKGDKNNETFGG